MAVEKRYCLPTRYLYCDVSQWTTLTVITKISETLWNLHSYTIIRLTWPGSENGRNYWWYLSRTSREEVLAATLPNKTRLFIYAVIFHLGNVLRAINFIPRFNYLQDRVGLKAFPTFHLLSYLFIDDESLFIDNRAFSVFKNYEITISVEMSQFHRVNIYLWQFQKFC